MDIKSIGGIINMLRKEKGITQEELGKAVGVSTQAVSKWECGGVPDTELLPVIADYFNVSIDKLFGRNIGDYDDIDSITAKYISSIEEKQRMHKTFEHCWALERSLGGTSELEEYSSLSAIRSKENRYVHSRILSDFGFTLMCLNEKSPYFLLMPEPVEGWGKALVEDIDYLSLFQLLADKDVFSTLLLLYKRENKAFTSKLLNKNLDVTIERADEILRTLESYSLIATSEVELDDEVMKMYNFKPNPAFIALLAFSKEIIVNPNSFYWYHGGREFPYLR